MTKTGNTYLRYFLIQAANTIRRSNAEFNLYFSRKIRTFLYRIKARKISRFLITIYWKILMS